VHAGVILPKSVKFIKEGEETLCEGLLKYYYQKRNAFPVLDQSAYSILAPYFPAGNAVRFQYRTYEIRKPKTRNASRFRRLTLVKLLNLITPDPDNGMILLLLAESHISIVFVKSLLDILRFILCYILF
jgi:hypothetical protein